MNTIMLEDAGDNYLSNLREQLTIFMNRDKIEIEQNHLQELGQSFLDEINQRFTNQNQIIKYIALRWNDFLNSWVSTKEQQQLQINELNQQLQEKTASIDNLQQIVTFLQNKAITYEEEYEKLKTDLLNVSEKMEKLETDTLTHKKSTEINHKQIVQACEKHKYTISTLLNEKQILLDQIKNERKINSQIEDELSQLANKLEIYGRQCKISQQQLQQSTKYCQQLECILNQKNQTISQLQIQIKQFYQKQFQNTLQTESMEQLSNLDPQNAIEKLDKSIKLQDQIPYGEPFAYEFHRRLSELNFNPNRLLDDDIPTPLKMNMDPYFAHFVLTSQSVKIKEDCEQLLNIDAKPFYSQIVEKRIPMHLWDQWIRNKLKQIVKLRKAANQSDSEDDQ